MALDLFRKRVPDSALPVDDAELRALLNNLKEHVRVLFVLDQPATIGALPTAVARAKGVAVAYLPGLAMRRISDLHAGEAKADTRDAYVIEEATRSTPHTLRSVELGDNEVAELTILCGCDDDLAQQITQTGSRLRSLLTQIHPALDHVVRPHLDHQAMLDLIERHLSSVSEQTLVVLGTQDDTITLTRLAQQLTTIRRQRDESAKEVER